jgi:hypothetical protein
MDAVVLKMAGQPLRERIIVDHRAIQFQGGFPYDRYDFADHFAANADMVLNHRRRQGDIDAGIGRERPVAFYQTDQVGPDRAAVGAVVPVERF